MKTIAAAVFLFTGLAGMLGTVGWILRRGNSNRMTKLFIVCQLSIAFWIISQLLKMFSVTDFQLTVSYLIGNAGICTFASFWLMFSAEYSKVSSRIHKAVFFLPFVTATMFAVIALNPLHRLYYAEFGTNGIKYGFLFYIFQLIFYIFVLTGISLMFIKYAKRSSLVSNQALLLALAAAVPLFINIFTISGIIKSEIELTPLFFAFSVFMVLIAIRKYGLLNINRIAFRDTINNIDTAVFIFGNDGVMTFRNRFAESLINTESSDYDGFINDISSLADYSHDEIKNCSEFTIDNEKYSMRQNILKNKNDEAIAKIIMISNVSEYYELAETEKKLSIEHERNRIAQEIHDSAGHTFTMISSLAKIMQADARTENISAETIMNYSAEIDGLSRSGITQLRCSINNLRDDEFMTSVTRVIKTVTESVRNIRIDTCIQGTEDERFSFCIKEIYDSVRETVTNAMRYSCAERIDIIVKFLSDRLELYIFDNGKGCAEINENNGLRGIRERTEELGGTVKFTSIEGEGFNTIIKIPVAEKES